MMDNIGDVSPLVSQEPARPEQTRQERIQASLKEREREVQMSRSAQEKEWGRERDQLKKKDAQQHFKALLVDMVANAFFVKLKLLLLISVR